MDIDSWYITAFGNSVVDCAAFIYKQFHPCNTKDITFLNEERKLREGVRLAQVHTARTRFTGELIQT